MTLINKRTSSTTQRFSTNRPHRKCFADWANDPKSKADRARLWSLVLDFINTEATGIVVGKKLCKYVLSDPSGQHLLNQVRSSITPTPPIKTINSFPTLLFEWEIINNSRERWKWERLEDGRMVYDSESTQLIDHGLDYEDLEYEAKYGDRVEAD